MERMGPAPAVRLEPRRSEDRQQQERQPRKGSSAASPVKAVSQVEEDRAQVAAEEPETHQLDERA
jgi:hypothetical protein